MRAAIGLFLLALVASRPLLGQDKPAPKPDANKDNAPAFTPDDFAKTVSWIHTELYKPLREATAERKKTNNNRMLQATVREVNGKLQRLVKQKVKWKLPLAEINDKLVVILPELQDKKDRSTIEVLLDDPDTRGRNALMIGRHVKIAPSRADALKAGDEVVVEGAVFRVVLGNRKDDENPFVVRFYLRNLSGSLP